MRGEVSDDNIFIINRRMEENNGCNGNKLKNLQQNENSFVHFFVKEIQQGVELLRNFKWPS